MENETKNPWDNVGGDYIKLERDKAKLLLLTNWRIEKIRKFKDDKGEIKEQNEFTSDVVNEDGLPVLKIYSTTSYSALRGLKAVLSKYHPDNVTPRMIRIKKIGEGKATIYDIEEQFTK